MAEQDVAEQDVAEQVDIEQMFTVAYEQEQPQEVTQQPEIEYATEGIEQYFSDSMFEQPQAVVEHPQAEAVDKVTQQDEAEPQQPAPQVQQQQYEQQATPAEPPVNYGGNQYGDQPARPNEAGQPEAKNGGNGKRGKPIFGRRKQAPVIDGAAPTEPQGNWADAIVKALSMRGQLVIVTGPSNVGKTTLVQGLADIAESIGCSVLMADFDINGRGLSYCSTKNYEAIHRSSYTYCSIRGAVNSGASGEWEAEIVSPGKHMLGTGLAYNKLGSDWANSEAVTKWAASCKTMYNLTICDVPWEFAMGAGQGLVFNSDFIVITSGLNNHDLMQLVLDMCNIDDDDVAQIVWDTSVMALTKVGDVKYVFGKKVRSVNDVLAAMDDQVA